MPNHVRTPRSEHKGQSLFVFLQSDHEKQVQRAKEVNVAANTAASGNSIAPALAQSDAATLYKKQDLSLKEGQTIKCVLIESHALQLQACMPSLLRLTLHSDSYCITAVLWP